MTKSIAINTAIRPATLTPAFAALETTIRSGMKAWEKVGQALIEINANTYYTERGFRTFESYVETIFDMSRDYAYKIMRGCEVVALLKAGGFTPAQMPANESQVRPLALVKDNDDLVCEIWDRVVASKKRITAKLVKEIADEMQGKGTPKDAKGDDKGETKGEGDTGDTKSTGDDLPDTSREDEIARLQHELAEARQRAATAEAKLAAVESGAKPALTKLQREMLQAGFKVLAKSADKGMKQALTDAKNALLS